jgi:hypothetical protein
MKPRYHFCRRRFSVHNDKSPPVKKLIRILHPGECALRKVKRLCRPIPVAARSAAARLLGLRIRNPPGAWMSVSYEFCVLPCRGL